MRSPDLRALPRWFPWALLVAFVVLRYAPMLGVPFLGDDYVFLDRTRDSRFEDLWSRSRQDFGWFRPWSRDVHFWSIQQLFGANEPVFRLVSLALWVAGLALYQRLVRALSDDRTAWLSTAAVASLALWGAPLVRISGTQDLWMVVWVLAAMLAHVKGRRVLAPLFYLLALLSKETAVALPVIVLAHALMLERARPRALVLRVGPYIALSILWLLVHPTLLARVVSGADARFGADVHYPPSTVLIRTLLSQVNADFLGHRLDWDSIAVAGIVLGLALLVGVMAYAIRLAPVPRPAERTHGLVAFGATWAISAWVSLFQASVGWHAYYTCLGALGAWLVLGVLLESRGRIALSAVVLLAALHLPMAASSGWDWGSEWYQRRAGNLLGLIRSQLRDMHPELPPHTRLYFGAIPNNIGLVAGNDSPAARVWYSDTTLHVGYYSYYRPRAAEEPAGSDLFFHFDSTSGIREVVVGPEDVVRARQADPDWAENHASLAMIFLAQGSPARAAVEFEKLAQFPDRPEVLGYAALSWEAAGDSSRTAALLAEFARRTGGTPAEVAAWAQRLRETMPRSRR